MGTAATVRDRTARTGFAFELPLDSPRELPGALCRPQAFEKVFLAGGGNQPFHPLRFLNGHLPACRRNAVISPALVVFLHRRAMPALLDGALNQKPLDDGV